MFQKELADLIDAVQLERETWAQECAKSNSNPEIARSETVPQTKPIRSYENSGQVKMLVKKINENSESSFSDDETKLLLLKIVGYSIE